MRTHRCTCAAIQEGKDGGMVEGGEGGGDTLRLEDKLHPPRKRRVMKTIIFSLRSRRAWVSRVRMQRMGELEDVMSLRLEDKEMHHLPKTRCKSPGHARRNRHASLLLQEPYNTL